MDNMTGVWLCRVYEIDVAPSDENVEKKEKGFLNRVKEKTLTDKDDKKKEILKPLSKAMTPLSAAPKIIPGRIWTTNRIRVKGNKKKYLIV